MITLRPDRKIKIRNTLSSLLSALLLASVVSNDLMATEVAGVLPGELSVTQTGAAKYSIPLAVIPGTVGMQPSLSLSYNSQSGSGMLGSGWSLNGLSSITRCGRTIVQDGVKGGIEFNDNDRFCLDGQRLVAVNGEYGQDGTEYRTEIDSFARVYSYGRKGHGPSWFKVQAKSGQTVEYGNSNDSRIEAQGKSEAFVWAQSKISDAVGNYLTVSYHENNDSSEYYPTRIDYTGNINAGTKTTNSIRFEYTDKRFSIGAYNGGSLFKSNKNLVAINTWHLETKVSEFRFEYEEPEFESAMLTSIKQCDGNGKCLLPTTFDWLKSTYGDVDARLDAESEWGNDTNEEYVRTKTEGWTQYFADMNEDGLPDVVMGYVGSLGAKVKVAYNVGDRIGGMKHMCSRGPMNFRRTEKGEGWSHSFMDMNGDGRLDYVMKYFGKYGSRVDVGINRSAHCGVYSKWEIIRDDEYLRTDTGEGWSQHLIDMNGNGLPDHVMSYFGSLGTKIKVSLNTGFGLEPQSEWESTESVSYSRNYKGEGWSQYLIDMNADALPDHVMGYFGENGSKIEVALNTGSGFNRSERWEATEGIKYTRTDLGEGWAQYFADINGDGLPDNVMGYIGREGVKVRVALNNGAGFESASYWVNREGIYTRTKTGEGWSQNFQDLNGDGLPEHILSYIGKTGATSRVAMNKGDGFGLGFRWYNHSSQELFRTETGEGWSQGYIDMNRDGLTDHVLSYSGKEGSKVSVSLNKGKSFSGIKTIVNSLDVKTIINYKTLSDEEVYTKGSDSIYPLIDLGSPINVVSDVSVDNGVGGQDATSYRYKTMKGHVTGRGILGFAEVDKTDHLTGLVTTTHYLQEFPYTGVVSGTQQRLNNGVMLRQVVNTWDVMTGDNEGIYYPYNSKSVRERYELDGSHISTTTQEEVYDDFGNATNINVVVSGDSEIYTKESYNKYINDTDLWHLGRLTRASVKHTNNEGSITKTSAFEYNSNGLLSKEVIEPDDMYLSLETDYSYDLFGNKTVSTTYGHGVESRSTTTAYTPDGRFPFSLTNALGHTETYKYDPLHGRIISQTGPNGLTTQWSYDNFGRKTHEERADGTWSSVERGFCQIEGCSNDAPVNAVMYTVTQSAGNPPVITYADKLGRELVTLKTGFNGQSIRQETQYNEFGQVARTLSPYAPLAGNAIKLEHWIEYEYDLLGRVVNTSNASNVVSFIYQGLTTETTDLLGHKKRTIHNLQGEVARVEEEENTWVEYKYDPTGNLIETNSSGAISRITYDLRGRKIATDDPSMGNWEYRYNVFGELIEQKDANGHLTELAYDVLGRKIKRNEPEGTTTWQYDSADNGIGKVYTITGPDGYAEVYAYDELGRAKRTEQHTVDGILSHELEYDDYGRVVKEVRPGGFVVSKIYNEYGFLESVLSPKEHVSDYSWSHLEGILEVATITAEKAYDKALFYSDKAAEYRAEASRYMLIADIYRDSGNTEEIETLRSASETLEDYANQLQTHADQYKSQADQSLQIANKYKRYARNKVFFGWIYRWLSDAYSQQAKRHSNQYDKYRLLAEETLIYLQEGRDDIDLKAASLIEIAEYYIQRSEDQIVQSNESQKQSNYYTSIANRLASGKVFEGADFYQAMVDDGESGYVTFWRALERDDHNRLTKYVLGNGLITNDSYDLFTGQLNNTRTGFSHENDIRSISYRYDANNNAR
ncbi:MAG: SpvB/TcaC N-terminal domain-containing protein, partial [Sedimenticola sp.]